MRLASLQLSDDSYFNSDFAIQELSVYPERGLIYDRNGNLLVANQPSYELIIIPENTPEFDTISFSNLINIDPNNLKKEINSAIAYSTKLPSVIKSQISKEENAFLQEKIWQYKGFYLRKNSVRDYVKPYASNVIGYTGEVDKSDISNNSYYEKGEMIGKQGIEKYYEDELKGIKGKKYFQKDRFNRDIGSFNDGLNDINSIPGNDLTITIDSELQEYGELLMSNKKGAIVAIEPSSGELLTLVSAPSYNPNLLVGRERSKNYFELYQDSIYKPLLDKGLLSTFPAGSPFKVIVGLIALEEEVISEKSTIFCKGQYIYGRNKKSMKCHCGGGYRNIYNAISESCNSYFADIYRKTISKNNEISDNFNSWSESVKSFGLGNYLNNDLPIGKKGMIPTSEFYDRWYPDFRWGPTTNLSNSIGQGEILVTPIQLANMIAAVANKGFYYTPHIIKKIEGDSIPMRFKEKKTIDIEKKYFDIIEVGLSKVYESGTGKLLNIPGIEICGKSGTAENFTKINGKKTQLTDHSIFVAYAPKDDPKIAIAVVVENGYYGSTWAGRITSLMIEKYLKGDIKYKVRENSVLNKNLYDEYIKPFSNKPFTINKL
mgnify:CR=1 FL=1